MTNTFEKKLKKFFILLTLLVFTILTTSITTALAAGTLNPYADCADRMGVRYLDLDGKPFNCPNDYDCKPNPIDPDYGNYTCQPLPPSNTGNKQFDLSNQFAFGKVGSLGEVLSRLALPAFSLAAVAVIFYFLIGAIKYLTSGGDKNAVSSAQAMITHAIIGFFLLIMLFLIMQYIPQIFGFRISIF